MADAWVNLPEVADSVDWNAAADPNQLMMNIRVIVGNGVLAPTKTMEELNTALSAITNAGLFRQAIINPDGAIAQRGTSGTAKFTAATTPANNDDTYLFDRINYLSDGNNITEPEQSTDAPEGSQFSMKYVVTTANKKFSPFCQIFENKNSVPFYGHSVSVSFQAKTTALKLIENLRCAVLSWDGAADTVTSDVVSAWNAEGANITPVANWTLENVPINIAIDTNWTKYSIENIDIDTAGMTNLALFIWVDDTDAAVGDELFIDQLQFNEGATVLDFCPRDIHAEEKLCKDYYRKSYDLNIAPGTVNTNGMVRYYHSGLANADHTLYFPVGFEAPMRTIPTVHVYGNAGTIDKVSMAAGEVNAVVGYLGQHGFYAGGTNGAASALRGMLFHYTADAEL